MQKGMAVGHGYGTTNMPAPNGPSRYAWNTVASPLTTSMEKTAQAVKSGELSVNCAKRRGNSAIGVIARRADWTPSPRAT